MSTRNEFALWTALRRGALVATLVGSLPLSALAQSYYPCPCPAPAQGATAQPGQTGQAAQPGQAGQAAPNAAANQPANDMFAQANNEAAAPSAFSPNMIGDFFFAGVPYNALRQQSLGIQSSYYPSPSGGFLGRQKMADDNSPLPEDRIFVDYDYFHNACLSQFAEVNTFNVGFEKTFLNGLASVELVVPVGSSQSSNLNILGSSISYGPQLGNLEVVTKGIIRQTECWTLSGGVGVTCPTAPDENIYNGTPGPTTLLGTIQNQSVHLMPYFGLAVEDPCSYWFGQGYIQVDVAPNGDPVYGTTAPGTLPVTRVGTLTDQTLLYVDGMVGRWLWRDDCCRRISGLAVVAEAHYTQALEPGQTLTAGTFTFASGTPTLSILDVTVGLHAKVGQTVFTFGYGTPITSDRGFDGELRVGVNRFF